MMHIVNAFLRKRASAASLAMMGTVALLGSSIAGCSKVTSRKACRGRPDRFNSRLSVSAPPNVEDIEIVS